MRQTYGYPAYDGARVGEHTGFHILDRALELGVTHWDTANSYNAGAGNEELISIAERKGCTLAHLAIAWLLAHDVTVSAIAGVTALAHLEDNVKAIHVTLTEDDLAEIDELTS